MNWFGLSASGKRLMLTPDAMSRWALDNNVQFQVGWSNHYQLPDGARMVRGENPTAIVRNALNAGCPAGRVCVPHGSIKRSPARVKPTRAAIFDVNELADVYNRVMRRARLHPSRRNGGRDD